MKHQFHASLAKGKAGEAQLAKLWPELKPIEGGRKGDFMLGPDKVEVKSDSYDTAKTKNFFIERWSDVKRKKPGSLWQALEHECNIFVYWYPANKIAYVFDTVVLKNYLDAIITEYPERYINNYGFTSVGYLVPRHELEHMCTEIKQWE